MRGRQSKRAPAHSQPFPYGFPVDRSGAFSFVVADGNRSLKYRYSIGNTFYSQFMPSRKTRISTEFVAVEGLQPLFEYADV